MDKIRKVAVFLMLILCFYIFFADWFFLPPYTMTPHDAQDNHSVDLLVREYHGEEIRRSMTHITKDLQNNIYIGFEPTTAADLQYQGGLILVYGNDNKDYTLEFKAGRPYNFYIDSSNLLHLQCADSPALTQVYTLQGEHVESYPTTETFASYKQVSLENGATYQIGGVYSLTLTKIASDTTKEIMRAPGYLAIFLLSAPYAFAVCTLLVIIYVVRSKLHTPNVKS